MTPSYAILDWAGRAARTTLPDATPTGDPDLCRRLLPYLTAPVAVLRGVRDPQTGARGTRVVTLGPGSAEWLRECLQVAAEELGVTVIEETP